MVFQLERIKQDVRVCLDRNQTDTALISDGDEETLQLDEIIQSKVLEAVERVETEAPYYLLEQGNSFQYDNDGVDDDSNGVVDDEPRAVYWKTNDTCGWIFLPEDFMRLVVFEMNDWEVPVYNAISTADPDYLKQRSRVKGIRGCAERPVVAIGVRPEGKVLEFYSCKSNTATVTKAVYRPYPTFDLYGGVDISERCYKAVVYMTAGLTLTSCGEPEKAKNYFEMAKTYLEK